jgi:hypothetical protein
MCVSNNMHASCAGTQDRAVRRTDGKVHSPFYSTDGAVHGHASRWHAAARLYLLPSAHQGEPMVLHPGLDANGNAIMDQQ